MVGCVAIPTVKVSTVSEYASLFLANEKCSTICSVRILLNDYQSSASVEHKVLELYSGLLPWMDAFGWSAVIFFC